MNKYSLSILVPSRNEEFLSQTVNNILENIESDTEIIVGLDGKWSDPPVIDDPRVTILYYGESVGQRGMTNQLCKLSKAKYVMKVDAHCAFDKGFDRKMLEAFEKTGDNVTMCPLMRNLHAFDWVCKKCGEKRYQGRSGVCEKCGGETFKDIKWIGKESPQSTSYRFDTTLHFQYFNEFKKRPEGKLDLSESFSLQGSCFMLTREKYWELDISEETFGSWGQQGTEVACKTWLSGGRVIINQTTWYAHMFRTQGGDFGFPYPLSGKQVDEARKYSRALFMENTWPKQIHPLSWLIDKFKPIPEWHDEKGKEVLDYVNNRGREWYDKKGIKILSKGIIYYTDNQLKVKIAKNVQRQLLKSGLPIVSSSLKPMDFGKNIWMKGFQRGYLTMFKQILIALEHLKTDIVYFCEHDVLYPKSHFDFTPTNKDTWYYNKNVWKVNYETGHAIKVDDCRQTSGICVYRDTALKHYRKRIELLKQYKGDDFNAYVRAMGFEPGTHNRKERVDDAKSEPWESSEPLVDIRHDNNLTSTRWKPEQFRNKKFTEGWVETDNIPHWNRIKF
jgi:ribosomal protein L37E